MKQTHNGGFFFRDSGRDRRREALRKSLRVIQGGKQSEPSLWDAETFRDDKFLRLHYLERDTNPTESTAGTPRQPLLWEDPPLPWE